MKVSFTISDNLVIETVDGASPIPLNQPFIPQHENDSKIPNGNAIANTDNSHNNDNEISSDVPQHENDGRTPNGDTVAITSNNSHNNDNERSNDDHDVPASCFGLPMTTCSPFRAGGFVGSLDEGGSVNCPVVTFCAHGAGTHTECIRHVEKRQCNIGNNNDENNEGSINNGCNNSSGDIESVIDVDIPLAMPALVVTVVPELVVYRGGDLENEKSGEKLYIADKPHDGSWLGFIEGDHIITAKCLESAVAKSLERCEHSELIRETLLLHKKSDDEEEDQHRRRNRRHLAIVVRVRGGSAHSGRRDWNSCNPPFFTADSLGWARDSGFNHLIVDLPSVDRGDDGGRLAAHKAFFGPVGNRESITELAEIPEKTAPDGIYITAIQVSPFALDAAPSRPILFTAQTRLAKFN